MLVQPKVTANACDPFEHFVVAAAAEISGRSSCFVPRYMVCECAIDRLPPYLKPGGPCANSGNVLGCGFDRRLPFLFIGAWLRRGPFLGRDALALDLFACCFLGPLLLTLRPTLGGLLSALSPTGG
jgi:hypothetical protein